MAFLFCIFSNQLSMFIIIIISFCVIIWMLRKKQVKMMNIIINLNVGAA